MKTYYFFIIISVFLFQQSCSFISFSRNTQAEREKIEKQFFPAYASINKNLKTNGFYWNNSISANDSTFFTYLSFKDKDMVIYFSNTAMTPDTLKNWPAIWNPSLTKDGKSTSTSDNGTYRCTKDSIFSIIHTTLLMGHWDYLLVKGIITENELLVDIEKLGLGSHSEKWKYTGKRFVFFPCQ